MMSTRCALNEKQKRMLTDYVLENPDMQQGRMRNGSTKVQQTQKWQNFSKLLNKVPNGAQKDWRTWRKTWQDLRNKGKVKAPATTCHAADTGGGSPQWSLLSSTDDHFLDTVRPIEVNGLQNVEQHLQFQPLEKSFAPPPQHSADLFNTMGGRKKSEVYEQAKISYFNEKIKIKREELEIQRQRLYLYSKKLAFEEQKIEVLKDIRKLLENRI